MTDYITQDELRKLFEQLSHGTEELEQLLSTVRAGLKCRYPLLRHVQVPERLSVSLPLLRHVEVPPVLYVAEIGEEAPSEALHGYDQRIDQLLEGQHLYGRLQTVPDLPRIERVWDMILDAWAEAMQRSHTHYLPDMYYYHTRGYWTHLRNTGSFWQAFSIMITSAEFAGLDDRTAVWHYFRQVTSRLYTDWDEYHKQPGGVLDLVSMDNEGYL